MQRALRNAPLVFAMVAAACQQVPVLNAAAPGHAVVVAGPHEGGPSLSLSVGLAEVAGAYGLLAESGSTNAAPIHRWVGADLVRYDVELRRRNATTLSQFDALIPALAGEIPVNAQGSGTATFTKLQPGAYYRAYVKAMGRKGGAAGTEAVVQLNANATADFADFDFTGNNDVAAQASRTVSVRLDDVAFNGQGGLAIGSPLPGGYASPTGALAMETLQVKYGLVVSTVGVQVPHRPWVDASGQVWVGRINNAFNSLGRLNTMGSVLSDSDTLFAMPEAYANATGGGVWVAGGQSVTQVNAQGQRVGEVFSISSGQILDLAVDSQGVIWVCEWSGNRVLRLSSSGNILSETMVPSPKAIVLDAQGQAWVGSDFQALLTKLSSQGSVLTTLSLPDSAKDIVALQDGQLWVSTHVSDIVRFNPQGQVLGTFALSNPMGMAVAPDGAVWVVSRGSNSVHRCDAGGVVLGSWAVASSPQHVAVGSDGVVWVASTSAHTLSVIRPI